MNLIKFLFGKPLPSTDLKQSFINAENSDKRMARDILGHCIISGLQLSQNGTPDLNLLLSAGEAYDSNGDKIIISGQQTINMSSHIPGSNSRYSSIYVKFARNNYDPRQDLTGATINYQSDESYEIIIVDGTASASPVLPGIISGQELIGDVLLTSGQSQIITGNINISRVNYLPGNKLNADKLDGLESNYFIDRFRTIQLQSWGSLITNPFGTYLIYSITYANNVFIAVGANGQIARSIDNGVSWGSLITNPFGTSDIRGIAFGNNTFVAVGAGGKIARSIDNGVSWGSLISNPFGTISLYAIVFNNNVFIAVSSNGQIARSIDNGVSWGSLITSPFTAGITAITAGNNVIIASGSSGKISRSIDDGLSWSSFITNPLNDNIDSLCYGNNIFLASGYLGAIARSLDYGITWGSSIANPFGSGAIYSIAFCDGIFVAANTNGFIKISLDGGLSWSSSISNPFMTNSIRKILFGNNIFIAAGANGNIAKTIFL
jgi:photosystem II stability/assembly factor-like uncharacterized protein